MSISEKEATFFGENFLQKENETLEEACESYIFNHCSRFQPPQLKVLAAIAFLCGHQGLASKLLKAANIAIMKKPPFTVFGNTDY